MNKHLKHLLIATGIGLFILIFFAVLNLLNGNSLDQQWLHNSLIVTFVYALPLYYASGYGFEWSKQLGNKWNLQPWQSVLLGFPLVMVMNVVLIILLQYILATYFLRIPLTDFGPTLWDRIKIPIWISLTIAIIIYIVQFIRHYEKRKLHTQEVKTLRVTQSHEALKSQIGPHFLFNSLNVLSGLVDENPEKAQDFIADLAQVYRYVLEQKDKDWVPLSEEISFAENYLELIKTRFENGLNIEIQPDLKTSDLRIAPLTLQLLLENCVKHNAISAAEPLNILIYSENDRLIVENNISPKKTFQQRKGTGLQQIMSRYDRLKTKPEIEKTDKIFKVKIPLITENQLHKLQAMNYTENEIAHATKIIKLKKEFRNNLLYIGLGMVFLLIVNILTWNGFPWVLFPAAGGAISLLIQYFQIYFLEREKTEEQQLQEYMEARQKRNI